MDCSLPGASVHGDSPGKNTGVGCHALLQGIFPTQGSNPGLPHCRWILYQLSHQGSPRILEWVAYPFPRGSYWHRNQIGVSCIAGGIFTSWASRKPQAWSYFFSNHQNYDLPEFQHSTSDKKSLFDQTLARLPWALSQQGLNFDLWRYLWRYQWTKHWYDF